MTANKQKKVAFKLKENLNFKKLNPNEIQRHRAQNKANPDQQTKNLTKHTNQKRNLV